MLITRVEPAYPKYSRGREARQVRGRRGESRARSWFYNMQYHAAIVTRFLSQHMPSVRLGLGGMNDMDEDHVQPKECQRLRPAKLGQDACWGVKRAPGSPPSRQITPENNLDLLSTHVLSARQHRGKALGIRILWTRWNELVVEQATQGCREDNNFTSNCHRNYTLLPSSVNHHPSNMQIRDGGGVRCYVGSMKVFAFNC